MFPAGLIVAALSSLSQADSVDGLKHRYLTARSTLVAGEYFVRATSFSVRDGARTSSEPWSAHTRFDYRKGLYADTITGKFRRGIGPGPWLVDCKFGFRRSERRSVCYSLVNDPKLLPTVMIRPAMSAPVLSDLHFDVRSCGTWLRQSADRMQPPEAATKFLFNPNRFELSQDKTHFLLTYSIDEPQFALKVQFQRAGFVPVMVLSTLQGEETYRCETRWQLRDNVFVPVKVLTVDRDSDGGKHVQQMLIRWKSASRSGLTADPTEFDAEEIGLSDEELLKAVGRNAPTELK